MPDETTRADAAPDEQHDNQQEPHNYHKRRVPHDHAVHGWSGRKALAAQQLALFLAPAVFFLQFQTNYLLVQWACARGGEGWLHFVSAVSIGLALIGVWMGWRLWQRAGGEAPGQGTPPESRVRLIAIVGGVISALFVLLMAAQWLPVFVLSPCQ